MNQFQFKLFADEVGFSTIGTTLGYGATATGPFTSVAGIDQVPALGGTPEQIDVTNLSNGSRVNIDGVKSQDQLTFSLFDQKGNITALKAIEGTNKHWKVSFPSGHSFTFQGKATVNSQEAAVNGAIKWNLVITVSSALTFTGAA
ncbi:phage tail tube protein [Pseudolactococcus reticulitermitis]|uniref:Phage tail protein n=1 Tax=Pseudolactococcus reticulitermitis TaxID=2025039 RepID=A0A224WWY2_9LACT|nr:phage tail tube protein [Lactococcus reticulitermitis]GAX46767.1 hypothetical protein RsY01_346 [Lactococcus reticulitermitis]